MDFAFDSSVRSYRRSQALDLLKVFYSNVRMITLEEYKEKKVEIEKRLFQCSIEVLSEFSSTQDGEDKKDANNVGIKQKYACNLFNLLFAVYSHHVSEVWDWSKISKCMTNYRSSTSLAKDAKKAYNKLANRIGTPSVSS